MKNRLVTETNKIIDKDKNTYQNKNKDKYTNLKILEEYINKNLELYEIDILSRQYDANFMKLESFGQLNIDFTANYKANQENCKNIIEQSENKIDELEERTMKINNDLILSEEEYRFTYETVN